MHLFPMIITLMVSLTQADPKFERQVLDDEVAIGYGLATGDVDGDGKPDILLADKKQFVWYRNGDWKRFVMVDNLTESDNVCIAARDIDGDGVVEVAVGAQWNPGETTDEAKSGSVHYLIRPADPTQPWRAVKLPHEPTTHRMQWVKASPGLYQLVVLPLHGRGNKGGEGAPVRVVAYEVPKDPTGAWKHTIIDESMHLTHNLDVVPHDTGEHIYIGGKEGVKILSYNNGKWMPFTKQPWAVKNNAFGEVRQGKAGDQAFLAGIEPMHGNMLTVYQGPGLGQRVVVADDLKQGHALAAADLLGTGRDQLVVGWREPNAENKMGIKIYMADRGTGWTGVWIDQQGMACEDLKVADLNGDNKPDIVAAGRASNNLVVYWNRNE